MSVRWKLACLTLLALSPARAIADHPIGIFGPGTGGPVVTPTADTLPAGAWTLGVSSEYRRFDVPSRSQLQAQALAEGHVHSLRYLWSFALTGAYGINDRFTLVAAVPYVRRGGLLDAHGHGGPAEVHALGDSAGPGDISIGGLWRFWDNGRGAAAAVSFGSRLPTGATDEIDAAGDRFGTEHQPGTGALRPFLGLTYGRGTGAFAWHANLRYAWATEGARDTDVGDRIDYRAAVAYRLGSDEEPQPHAHAPGVEAHHHDDEASLRWDLLLELTGEYQQPPRIAGVEEGEAERIIYLAPGFRVTGNDGWTAALSLGIPVSQHPGPGHIETDWRAVATLSYLL